MGDVLSAILDKLLTSDRVAIGVLLLVVYAQFKFHEVNRKEERDGRSADAKMVADALSEHNKASERITDKFHERLLAIQLALRGRDE